MEGQVVEWGEETYEEGSRVKVDGVVALSGNQSRDVNRCVSIAVRGSILRMALTASSGLLGLNVHGSAGAHSRCLILEILRRDRRNIWNILAVVVLIVEVVQVRVRRATTEQMFFLVPSCCTSGGKSTFTSCRLRIFAMFQLTTLTYLGLLTIARSNGLYIWTSTLYRPMRLIKVGYDLL